MFKEKTIYVVVPCYNEEGQVTKVITTMPDIVDKIILVDDCSQDKTIEEIRSFGEAYKGIKLELICHEKNQGVGGAIATGYEAARDQNVDIAVVMAGDAQMDPDDLPALLTPVVDDKCDYSKGNRLVSGDAWEKIPRVRYIGNSILSLLTKIASGYWKVADSQSGYTAINLKALKAIHWDDMFKRYGQPNDLLVRLNIEGFRVKDVPIRPVYGVGEKSGIKPIRMIPALGWLITKLFFYRLKHKYFIRDFHPLIFFYMLAVILLPMGLFLGAYLLFARIFWGEVADTSVIFSAFLIISGFQSAFFGMWMDMEYGKDLNK